MNLFYPNTCKNRTNFKTQRRFYLKMHQFILKSNSASWNSNYRCLVIFLFWVYKFSCYLFCFFVFFVFFLFFCLFFFFVFINRFTPYFHIIHYNQISKFKLQKYVPFMMGLIIVDIPILARHCKSSLYVYKFFIRFLWRLGKPSSHENETNHEHLRYRVNDCFNDK